MYIKKQTVEPPSATHNYITRNRGQYAETHIRLFLSEQKPLYVGLKCFQELPVKVKDIDEDSK